jgi:hypothetical protein
MNRPGGRPMNTNCSAWVSEPSDKKLEGMVRTDRGVEGLEEAGEADRLDEQPAGAVGGGPGAEVVGAAAAVGRHGLSSAASGSSGSRRNCPSGRARAFATPAGLGFLLQLAQDSRGSWVPRRSATARRGRLGRRGGVALFGLTLVISIWG